MTLIKIWILPLTETAIHICFRTNNGTGNLFYMTDVTGTGRGRRSMRQTLLM